MVGTQGGVLLPLTLLAQPVKERPSTANCNPLNVDDYLAAGGTGSCSSLFFFLLFLVLFVLFV